MWLLNLFTTLILADQLAATCDVCQSATNVACHNETSFSICMGGIPTYNLIHCPKDSYCTDGIYTCYTNTQPNCKPGQATDGPITETTSTNEPGTTEASSTSEKFTSTADDSTLPSEKSTTTTAEPTTTTTTATTTPESTTTTEAAWSAQATCTAGNKVDNYKNEDDPTCKTYINCFKLNGSYYASVTNCKTSKPYFNVAIKNCDDVLPADCTG